MRLLVTGSRLWEDVELVSQALRLLPAGSVVVHGNDGRRRVVNGKRRLQGLDQIAGREALRLGLEEDPFPADWGFYGKAAGGIRNQVMVDRGADLCLAFPTPWVGWDLGLHPSRLRRWHSGGDRGHTRLVGGVHAAGVGCGLKWRGLEREVVVSRSRPLRTVHEEEHHVSG